MPSGHKRESVRLESTEWKGIYNPRLRTWFFLRKTFIIFSSGFCSTEKLESKWGMGVLFSQSYLPLHSKITICSSHTRVHNTNFKFIFAHVPSNYSHIIYLYETFSFLKTFLGSTVLNLLQLWAYFLILGFFFFFHNFTIDVIWNIMFKQPGLILCSNYFYILWRTNT